MKRTVDYVAAEILATGICMACGVGTDTTGRLEHRPDCHYTATLETSAARAQATSR